MVGEDGSDYNELGGARCVFVACGARLWVLVIVWLDLKCLSASFRRYIVLRGATGYRVFQGKWHVKEGEILTALPPPPRSPPKGVHDDPAQVPLKQSRPVHERSEQLIPMQMPSGPQSGPEQPRLRQLSPKQCPLPPPPPPPPSQSEPMQPPLKQPMPLHTPSTQFGPMQPNGVQFVPVQIPLKQSLPEQPKLAQRSPGSC